MEDGALPVATTLRHDYATSFRSGGQLIATWPVQGNTATDLGGRGSANIWVSQFFWRAGWATYNHLGVFLYRPTIEFAIWGPGGTTLSHEFAVAEEDHNFVVSRI
jgi:hypothetical protein